MNDSFINPGSPARPHRPRDAAGRVAAIADAAAQVFTRQGWRLAQVADIAATAGVATGTIYLYAADKGALLGLAVCAAARLPMPADADLPAPALSATLLTTALERLSLPALQAFALGAPPEPRTLRVVIEELFDLLARERRLVLLLDRLAAELPDIREAYGTTVRASGLAAFETAFRRLAEAGMARRDVDASAAARAVLEMIAWMAMRRPGDALPPACDEATARHAAIELALSAIGPVTAARSSKRAAGRPSSP